MIRGNSSFQPGRWACPPTTLSPRGGIQPLPCTVGGLALVGGRDWGEGQDSGFASGQGGPSSNWRLCGTARVGGRAPPIKTPVLEVPPPSDGQLVEGATSRLAGLSLFAACLPGGGGWEGEQMLRGSGAGAGQRPDLASPGRPVKLGRVEPRFLPGQRRREEGRLLGRGWGSLGGWNSGDTPPLPPGLGLLRPSSGQ